MSRRLLIPAVALFALLLVACSPQSNEPPNDELAAEYGDLGSFGSAAQELDSTFDLEVDLADWQQVRDLNCDGARATVFDGFYMPDSALVLSADLQTLVSERAWAAALTSSCPDVLDDWIWTAEDERLLASADPSWQSSIEPGIPDLPPVEPIVPGDSSENSYEDYDYEDYGDFDWDMGVDGDGYAVRCSDGETSLSGGKQGACSGHGGVG